MEIYAIIVLAAAAALLAALLWNSRSTIRRMEAQGRELGDKLSARSEELQRLLAAKARDEVTIETLRNRLDSDKAQLEKVGETFRAEFRNLANDILEEKSRSFRQTNRESMDILLKPLKDNIREFRERVEHIYSDENQQRGALKNEIHNLMALNQRITQETANLTSALKGDSKVQGDWGEMILETILDNSNLIKGTHYFTQVNIKDPDGNNLRPDVVLHLPDGKEVVIDSKVSLTAYAGYTAAEDEESRSAFLRDHLRSVRAHVDELHAKCYQDLMGDRSPDFVIMFIPNEPAFLAALRNDDSIWNDAYRKRVIISSPTNLFALLKIVDDLWRRDTQSKHALHIAEEGGKLYDKFAGFVETMEKLGKSLATAQETYDTAFNQLKTGRGNLLARSEKLRKLGINAGKQLPDRLLDSADAEAE